MKERAEISAGGALFPHGVSQLFLEILLTVLLQALELCTMGANLEFYHICFGFNLS